MNDGQFKPGVSGNPNGRPKGSRNKINEELRANLADFLNGNVNTIIEDFKNMKPSYRYKLYVELMPYVIPRLSAQSNDISFESMTEEQLNQIIDTLISKANGEDETTK